MSKQSKAKTNQNYVPKATPQTCASCAHLLFEKGFHNEDLCGQRYPKEFNFRCAIGGFAVKKMATCDCYKSK